MNKILHVLKKPQNRKHLLADTREYDAAAAPALPEGWEQMTPAKYAAWSSAEIAAGWLPELEAVSTVPESVTPWQMLCALNQVGLRASVEAAVAAADQNTKDAWNRATRFPRNSPLLAGVATSAGMTDAQLDDLFRLAATFQ